MYSGPSGRPYNPVDVVHLDTGDLGLPAGQLAAAAGWWVASQLLFALVAYLLDGVLASPASNVHFSQDHVTPLFYIP